MEMMPANWEIQDQACVRVDLGVLQQGETLSFDISTDSEVDILLFSSNAITVYQNEQSYRSDSVWESDSVFEAFNGSGDWHWTVPSDRDATRWYMIVDNLAHPQDSGSGDQGGSVASVTLDIAKIVPEPFTLVDTIVRLESGESSVLYGPFSMDEGTQVRIEASTMEGAPDVFLMNQDQVDLYTSGGTAAARIQGTDMLLITSSRDIVWTVPSSLDGTDLYLVVDNRPGPSGGGAGTLPIATTVVLTLTPIMDPTITGIPSSGTVDVGSEITLDASDTPNQSNQISESGYSWDTDGDGFDDNSGASFNISWPEPTSLTIRLSVVGIDGRSTSVYEEIRVEDISPPSADISVEGILERAFNEDIVISASFEDNWGISMVEWLVDGIVITESTSDFDSTKTFSHVFQSGEESGIHLITLRVTDLSGMIAEDTASIQVFDSSPPVEGDYDDSQSSVVGEMITLEVPFEDDESVNIYYSWDFDALVDSDGDGDEDNDEDAVGPSVSHVFDSSGVYRVICRAQNDEGLVSEAEILVSVTLTSGDDELGMTEILMAVAAVILLAIISFVLYLRIASNRRMSALLAEEEKSDDGQESEPTEISVEDQKAMWGASGTVSTSSPSQSFGAIGSGMSGSISPDSEAASIDLSDEEFDELLSESSTTKANNPADDLLSAFQDDDEEIDTEESIVEYSFPEDDSGEVDTANEVNPAKVFEIIQEEPELESDKGLDRTVRSECSSCGKMFEVDLPEGVDRARTACPHCGSIESIALE